MERALEGCVKFSPPLYIQRYVRALAEIEAAPFAAKVVEFGCASLKLVPYLKRAPNVRKLLAVDCDADELRDCAHRAAPNNADYFRLRSTPFEVSVLHGSVVDPDYRLIGCDAVVCIELIEHLNPGTLDRFPQNIFGYIEPYTAIITTPNADFNALFPSLKCGQFRHFDHRFEWTREQFQDWANNITVRFPNYTVEFYGIGEAPERTERLGQCTQMAKFVHRNYTKKDEIVVSENSATDSKSRIITEELDLLCNRSKAVTLSDSLENISVCNDSEPNEWDNINSETEHSDYFTLISHYVYPFYVDSRSLEQKIMDDVTHRIRMMTSYDSRFYDEDNRAWVVPVDVLTSFSDELKTSCNELGELLSKNGHKIMNDHLIVVESAFRDDSEDNSSNYSDVEETNVPSKTEECWTCASDSIPWDV